jgi:hypothetical protein
MVLSTDRMPAGERRRECENSRKSRWLLGTMVLGRLRGCAVGGFRFHGLLSRELFG